MITKFITVKEAAILLRISRPTIDRFIAKRTIPSYKIGGRRLFDEDELIKWVKRHRSDKPKKSARGESKKKGGGK